MQTTSESFHLRLMASARLEPTKPAPPVMRNRIGGDYGITTDFTDSTDRRGLRDYGTEGAKREARRAVPKAQDANPNFRLRKRFKPRNTQNTRNNGTLPRISRIPRSSRPS